MDKVKGEPHNFCWLARAGQEKYSFFLDKLRRAKSDCGTEEEKVLSGKSVILKPQKKIHWKTET